MFAVGRIGSYISRGVYSVSGPFHPFGGAVDIVVVEQPDGTFKSSPWYVRFGKFQGVLKASERVVIVNVNGVDADFNMHLDHKGEAFFLREVDAVDVELEPYVSSGDEMDVKADLWRHQKSKSCNFDADQSDLVSELESCNGKNVARNNSRRRFLGFSFGRRSMKENGFQDRAGGTEVDRVTSMERAEIAADLLEVRWSTNLRVGSAQLSPSKSSATEVVSEVIVEDGLNKIPFVTCDKKHEVNSSDSDENFNKKDADIPISTNPEDFEVFTLEEAYMKVGLPADISTLGYRSDYDNITGGKSPHSDFSLPAEVQGTEGSASYGEEHISCRSSTQGESYRDLQKRVDKVESSQTSSTGGETELCNTDEAILPSELGASVTETSGGQAECVNLKSDAGDISSSTNSKLVKASSLEPSDCLKCSVNKLCYEGSFVDSNDPSYVPVVTREEISTDDVHKSLLTTSAEKCSGDSVSEREAKLHSMDKLEEEQFCFSDLDDHKVHNDESLEVASLGGRDSHSRDLPGSSEDEWTDKDPSDDQLIHSGKLILGGPMNDPSAVNLKSVSSPISISKLHKDTDEQARMLGSESLPNMLCNDGDLKPHGAPHLIGCSLDSNLKSINLLNDVPVSSDIDVAHQQIECLPLKTEGSHFSEEIAKILSDPAVEVSLCKHLLCEGMGYEAAGKVFDAAKLDRDNFSSFSPETVKDESLVVRIGGLYFPWDAALPIASAIGSQGREQILEPKGMIAVGQVDNRSADQAMQKTMSSSSGSWKMWPFSFKGSHSTQDKSLDSESASEPPAVKAENTNSAGAKVLKKKIRAKAPTSEQLASLNLKEGKNEVTFTFSTAMLGKQQIDARIFLWKWDARIVISDVDGTITKSDVLGQFMPLMGMDWSQTGVTHLFSAIKENGYQVLFLSARSISQAYQTRQFLMNLKQDGKELPEGPVLISPDGLFPSLYREVIRRAPHEFKIACLEDIKVLFPPDHNPFYAGFGNRDTDEISYLKVGIPIGKIFIINPKGQIAVNRRVDTKSYTNLHALVNGMFPPAPATEQEDYNTWNFWRLPPPDIF